ncbi:MAG: hypothetical protein HY314_03700 [Acidobacteria bacterium]|nr:hypothetical protein [Acidobacteriota bacterium]
MKVDLVGDATSEEISIDDGDPELEYIEDDLIVVNRLTPPDYPTTLESIRVVIPSVDGAPDPEGGQITLLVYTDPSGVGQPPGGQPAFSEAVTITRVESFMTFTVPTDLTVESGDFYVGYQVEAPASGVGFALDTSNPQRCTFLSRNDGRTFQRAVIEGVEGNTLIRAVVSLPEIIVPLVDGMENVGAACWRVTGSAREARIRVSAESSLDGSVISGLSDPFTISEALQSITVISPASGDVWRNGEIQTMEWDFERLVGAVRIELLGLSNLNGDPDTVRILFDGAEISPQQKNRQVSVPQGIYKMKISSSLDALIFDESDFFYILEPTTIADNPLSLMNSLSHAAPHLEDVQPSVSPCGNCAPSTNLLIQAAQSIKVATPNGGEVFEFGDQATIAWDSQGVQGKVNIVLYDLSRNAQSPEQIALFSKVENTGSIQWTVPFRLSDALKIGVFNAGNSSINDVSDGVFTIGIPGQGRITLLMPNGLEEFAVGTETRILWMSEGDDVGDRVRIDISFDGGMSYQVLFNDVTNNGDRRWGINFQPADNLRLRIVSQRSQYISDVSNCTFRIVGP